MSAKVRRHMDLSMVLALATAVVVVYSLWGASVLRAQQVGALPAQAAVADSR